MTRTDPILWQIPTWHPDCDGDFLFAGLRLFATALLNQTDLDAKLAIVEEGYAHLEVFHGATRIGLVYANRSHEPPTPMFTVYAGAEDDELSTTDIAATLRFLDEHRTAFPEDAG